MKHVLLTGPPGVGKTTLVEKVCAHLVKTDIKIAGFYTKELRNAGQRVGFDVVCLSGHRSPLARAGSTVRGPKVGKYTVDIASFESSVLPLLSRPTVDQRQIYVIDEIGKMELFSDRFKRKVRDLLNDSNSVIFGTIPLTRSNGIPFVETLKAQANIKVFQVSLHNRDTVFSEIVQAVLSNFQVSA